MFVFSLLCIVILFFDTIQTVYVEMNAHICHVVRLKKGQEVVQLMDWEYQFLDV